MIRIVGILVLLIIVVALFVVTGELQGSNGSSSQNTTVDAPPF